MVFVLRAHIVWRESQWDKTFVANKISFLNSFMKGLFLIQIFRTGRNVQRTSFGPLSNRR
jgi:hypothetical protein